MNSGHPDGTEGRECLDEEVREPDAGDRADRRKQEVFGQELPREPSLLSTDGDANCDLLPARERAREDEIGDIRTSDQQDERDGAQQKQEGRTNVSDNRFTPALHRDVDARILRKLFPDLCGQEREIRLRLGDRHAGLQAADHVDKVVRPGIHRVPWRKRFRGPDFSACIRVFKRHRDHAHHNEGLAAQQKGSADD